MATARKVAPKKATSKKVSTKEVELTPLETFEGHTVTISSFDKNIVRFGCGAVTVNKKDLRAVAELLKDKEIVKTLKGLAKKLNDDDGFISLLKIDVKVLEAVMKIKKNPTTANSLKSLSNLVYEGGAYADASDILSYSSTQLERLALVTKED